MGFKAEIKPSDEAITRLKKLERGGSRTFVGKRIVRMQIAAVLLLILMIPTVVFAGYSLSQIVFEKTKRRRNFGRTAMGNPTVL